MRVILLGLLVALLSTACYGQGRVDNNNRDQPLVKRSYEIRRDGRHQTSRSEILAREARRGLARRAAPSVTPAICGASEFRILLSGSGTIFDGQYGNLAGASASGASQNLEASSFLFSNCFTRDDSNVVVDGETGMLGNTNEDELSSGVFFDTPEKVTENGWPKLVCQIDILAGNLLVCNAGKGAKLTVFRVCADGTIQMTSPDDTNSVCALVNLTAV